MQLLIEILFLHQEKNYFSSCYVYPKIKVPLPFLLIWKMIIRNLKKMKFYTLGIFMGENKCGSEALCFWALVLGSEKKCNNNYWKVLLVLIGM